MSFFKRFKSDGAKNRLSEEYLYELVAKEISSGVKRDGLWAKALSESGMNEELAKAVYIKLRVQSLKDELVLKNEKLNEQKPQSASSNVDSKIPLSPQDYSIGAICLTSHELTCQNCGRFGKMLIKKSPWGWRGITLFIFFGGTPGTRIALLVGGISSPEEYAAAAGDYLGFFSLISYIILFFYINSKKIIACSACGNSGLIIK